MTKFSHLPQIGQATQNSPFAFQHRHHFFLFPVCLPSYDSYWSTCGSAVWSSFAWCVVMCSALRSVNRRFGLFFGKELSNRPHCCLNSIRLHLFLPMTELDAASLQFFVPTPGVDFWGGILHPAVMLRALLLELVAAASCACAHFGDGAHQQLYRKTQHY